MIRAKAALTASLRVCGLVSTGTTGDSPVTSCFGSVLGLGMIGCISVATERSCPAGWTAIGSDSSGADIEAGITINARRPFLFKSGLRNIHGSPIACGRNRKVATGIDPRQIERSIVPAATSWRDRVPCSALARALRAERLSNDLPGLYDGLIAAHLAGCDQDA